MISLAIALLCFLNAGRVFLAIRSGDDVRLKAVTGMGGKTAAWILLVLSAVVGVFLLFLPRVIQRFSMGHW